MKNNNLVDYLFLTILLLQARLGGDPEDAILDKMDDVWYKLTANERKLINARISVHKS